MMDTKITVNNFQLGRPTQINLLRRLNTWKLNSTCLCYHTTKIKPEINISKIQCVRYFILSYMFCNMWRQQGEGRKSVPLLKVENQKLDFPSSNTVLKGHVNPSRYMLACFPSQTSQIQARKWGLKIKAGLSCKQVGRGSVWTLDTRLWHGAADNLFLQSPLWM